MFFKFNQDTAILAIGVDDITITGNSCKAIQRFKNELSSCYGIKDMSNLSWLLGIGINRKSKNWTTSFSQAAYVQKIVEHFGIEAVKPLSILIAPGHTLLNNSGRIDKRRVG